MTPKFELGRDFRTMHLPAPVAKRGGAKPPAKCYCPPPLTTRSRKLKNTTSCNLQIAIGQLRQSAGDVSGSTVCLKKWTDFQLAYFLLWLIDFISIEAKYWHVHMQISLPLHSIDGATLYS